MTSLDELIACPANQGFNGVFKDLTNLDRNVGEVFDVFCVAHDRKPLAGLDWSNEGKMGYRAMNAPLINKIMQYANKTNVQWIHNFTEGGMYLKSIFYKAAHQNRAIGLAVLMWGDSFIPQFPEILSRQVAIGLLFGYSESNIQGFVAYNYHTNLTVSFIRDIKHVLEKWIMGLSLYDLPPDCYKMHQPIPLL